jgi:hypothetical protein
MHRLRVAPDLARIAFAWSLTQMQMLADIGPTDRAPPRASAANDNALPWVVSALPLLSDVPNLNS